MVVVQDHEHRSRFFFFSELVIRGATQFFYFLGEMEQAGCLLCVCVLLAFVVRRIHPTLASCSRFHARVN